MATVTPNFNWPVPTSTDLVKDGATAIEALGDSIDASLVDLKGGTTGQVLSKTSGTDMDFTWVTSDDANAIQNTIVDAKGDLIAATAADTPARLAVGTNGQVLTADSTAATGLVWATAGGGGSTNVAGKNAILNSAMNVWQRGTSIAQTAAALYTADRWQGYQGTATAITYSRQTTSDTTNLPFIQYCMRVQRNSGSTSGSQAQLAQSLETVNSIPFAGKSTTVSFYARKGANYSRTSDILTFGLTTGTGTDQNFYSGFTGASTTYTDFTLTGTWQRFTYTATIPTTATQIALAYFFTPSGTAGANDYFEITGVQMEIAGSASAYSPNTSTYEAELAACRRYYFRTQNGSAFTSYVTIMCNTSTAGYGAFLFQVSMRAAPSSVDFANLRILNVNSSVATVTNLTIDNSGNDSTILNVTVASMTSGIPAILQNNNNSAGYIGFSAEL